MIKVSSKQKGNAVISYLTHSSFIYDDGLTTDYEINDTISVLFLSLRFHCCKPEYIYKRLNKLKPYKLSILLVYVDSNNYNTTLLELFDRITSCVIILGFTNEECARYLKGFDINHNRPINILRRKEDSYTTFLEAFPKLNKTDINCILENYKSLKEFFEDIDKNVKNIKGIGELKIKNLKEYYEMDFKK